MSTGNNVGTAVTSILTIGVGGLVGYVKRYIRLGLDEAAKVRQLATKDLDQIKADIEQIKAQVVKPVARKAPVKKASATKTTTIRKAGR